MNIRISTKGKRPMRSLTPSDKVQAIQRIHDGESKASVARDIGVPESTLRGWCKNEDKLRFMSRQAAAEKNGDPLALKYEPGSNIISGPPEKRQRVESANILNFSNKIKYDEINAFKHASMNSMDFGTSKALTELSNFSALTSDYGVYNSTNKNKIYGADMTRTSDPSITATSPLSSLTNLSGLTGIGHSPMAISFSELTSNLSILAQLNPGLAAMSGLNGLTSANLRNVKQKPQSHGQNQRGDISEKQIGLTVKNWAKQKPSTPNSSDSSSFGVNLCQNDLKGQVKNTNNSNLVQQNQMGDPMPSLTSISEDPLLYWLKSQQALLGLNNLYNQTPGSQSSPLRPTTPHQTQQATTPPIIPNPLTPSSTPSGSLDDKNAAWFNWCKAFGASLSSITPAAAMAALQANATSGSVTLLDETSETSCTIQNDQRVKREFENILYSQLTKDSISSHSPRMSPSVIHVKNELTHSENSTNRPEDLSAKSKKARSLTPNYISDTALRSDRDEEQSLSIHSSPAAGTDCEKLQIRSSVAECRDVLDNLLYKINSNVNVSNEIEIGLNNEIVNVDETINKGNNVKSRTSDEVWIQYNDSVCAEEADSGYLEAIMHGEKFLQWLEKCGDSRVTSVQMMQLRYLLSSIKREVEDKLNLPEETNDCLNFKTIEIDDSCEESNPSNVLCRK